MINYTAKDMIKKISKLILAIISISLFASSSLSAQDTETVCAKVRIEIVQELGFERQAFDAKMRISNTLDTQAIEEVNINVLFEDEDGNPVLATSDPNDLSADFFIRLDSLDGINDVSGAGVVEADSTAEIHWLIIPAAGAAKDSLVGVQYFIGASLSYTLGGELQEVEVAPDFITIKPQPELELDYFLTSEVRADDPLTPAVEAPEPFTLGVRVLNTGLGTAKNVTIDSAQPRIIENEQGLLIGFQITDSFVDDNPATPSLLLNFGDILGGGSRVGRWLMQTTLSGTFSDFSASFTHADELGGKLTSLLTRVSTHLLLKDVYVDLPGRDTVRDFLALDGAQVKVYESHGLDTAVTNYSSSSTLVHESTNGESSIYYVDVPPTAGFLYLKVSDPHNGTKSIQRVTRSDGKVLPLENAWVHTEGNGSNANFFASLFDANGGGRYRIEFGPKVSGPQAPVIQFIQNFIRVEGQSLSFIVTASDPNGTIPTLSLDSKPVGASFIDNADGTGTFTWNTGVGQAATYPLTFRASDGTLESARSMKVILRSIDDTDGDGLKDAWELEYFGDLDRDGSGDFDSDGLTDKEEHDQGTDPTFAGIAPSVPLIDSPAVGAEVVELTPTLRIINSDHGVLLPDYEFELYADSELTSLLASASILETPSTTAWVIPNQLQDNTRYYWRVRAKSKDAFSEWAYGNFFINSANDAPGPFTTSSPSDGAMVSSYTPQLVVTNSSDPDGDLISYGFEVASDSAGSNIVTSVSGIVEGSSGTTSWTVLSALSEDTEYYWRGIATDEHGAITVTDWASFFLSTMNNEPLVPIQLSPIDGEEVASNTLELKASASEDPEGDPVSYLIELDSVNTFDSPNKVSSGSLQAVNNEVTLNVADLSENTTYFWRIKATDGGAESAWALTSFFVNLQNDPPSTPSVVNPGNGAWVELLRPAFQVTEASDPDFDTIKYRFEIYTDSALTTLVDSGVSTSTTWTANLDLLDNVSYYWRARAEDEHGEPSVSWTPVHTFFVNQDGVDDPPSISIDVPNAPLEVSGGLVEIRWTDADPDSNASITLKANEIVLLSNAPEDPDGTSDTYSWNVDGVEPGQYLISATITDGVSTVNAQACCLITIVGGPGTDSEGDGVPDEIDNCPIYI